MVSQLFYFCLFLICISFRIHDLKLLFMCLFAICISSLNLLGSLAQFLIRCFIFLLLNVKFLCIFWKRGSYQIWAFWKYFILVCSLSFHSLNIVYCTSEAFNLSPAYQFFLSGIIYLVLYLKSHHHFQDQ